MAAKTFEFEIVTPEKRVYAGTVRSLRAPGSEGSFGVLPRHAPLLAALEIGSLSFVDEEGRTHLAAISGGFAEVEGKRVVVLAESAELAEAIDVERAAAARDRALKRLSSKAPDLDVERARLALMRALNRLKVAGRL